MHDTITFVSLLCPRYYYFYFL